jgi:hypothetical protein
MATPEAPKRIFRFGLCILLSIGVLLSNGCDKPVTTAKQPVAPSEEETASIETAPAKPAGPGKDEKICFSCKSEGTAPCRTAGCVKGQIDCPSACLKMSRGSWIHMEVAGHDPSELWQKFPNQSGRGGYQAWNHHHVGEVIEYANGVAVNVGKCKTCGGTTKVTCKTCSGTGKQTCEVCQGKKFIPVAWTATDNPWFNSQPDLIRLKDGQAILGRIAMSSGEERTIVTRDKRVMHVKASDILPKEGTNSPAIRSRP